MFFVNCKLFKPVNYLNFNIFPKPESLDKELQCKKCGVRVTCSQMHPVPTCHFCFFVFSRQDSTDSAPEKPPRLRGNEGNDNAPTLSRNTPAQQIWPQNK